MSTASQSERSRVYYLRNRDSIRQRHLANRERQNELRRQRILRNPEKYRAHSWTKRGMSTPIRPRPVLCECCGQPCVRGTLAADHDHATGQFRGWLCFKCNTAIGKLGDTLERVRHAVRYLERAETEGLI